MTKLAPLSLPETLNYVGVFLTFGCNLKCAYCINDPRQEGERGRMVADGVSEIPPDLWVRAFERLPARDDLPISLQGGEPTLYQRGRGVGEILAGCPDHRFDLLTNLAMPPDRMALCLGDNPKGLMRDAPYPTIRVSYHPDEMNRSWGDGIANLIARCEALAKLGFKVSPAKEESHVGIYMVAHPDNQRALDEARAAAHGRVAFETKEFLGMHDDQLYGRYRYPYSTNLVTSGLWPHGLSCQCRTSELLIDPLGLVWPCHYYLYETWLRHDPRPVYARLARQNWRFDQSIADMLPFPATGHILDPDFQLDHLSRFHACQSYGHCIGCDTKIKNNRFQDLDNSGKPHTSVEITEIQVPAELTEAFAAFGKATINP